MTVRPGLITGTGSCMSCRGRVERGHNFCGTCGYRVCPQCGHLDGLRSPSVHKSDRPGGGWWCTECNLGAIAGPCRPAADFRGGP